MAYDTLTLEPLHPLTEEGEKEWQRIIESETIPEKMKRLLKLACFSIFHQLAS